jgi:hypothetical protein
MEYAAESRNRKGWIVAHTAADCSKRPDQAISG